MINPAKLLLVILFKHKPFIGMINFEIKSAMVAEKQGICITQNSKPNHTMNVRCSSVNTGQAILTKTTAN